MDIKEKKLDLISWLIQLNDESIISKLNSVKELTESSNYCLLSDSEKRAIDVALDDILNNPLITHDAVMEATASRYPHLFNKD